MAVDRRTDISRLQAELVILEEENQLLAERAEETLLVALVSEVLNNAGTADLLLDSVLERTSLLKDIPYSAHCTWDKNEIVIQHVYTTLRDSNLANDRIVISPESLDLLKEGVLHIDSDLMKSGCDIHIDGTDSEPTELAVIPFAIHSFPQSFLLFLDTDESASRLARMIMLLQRIVDMVAIKLENLTLMQNLTEMSDSLDQEVRKKTQQLQTTVSDLEATIEGKDAAEEELRISEERFRLLFDMSPDSISLAVIETGEYVEVNQGFLTIFGYTRDAVIGKRAVQDLNIWVDPADRRRLVECLEKDGFCLNLPTQFRTKDQNIRQCLVSVKVLVDRGEELMLAVTRDITDFRRAQDAVNESEARYRNLFAGSRDAIYISDKGGIILDVNPFTEELFGYDRSDLLGQSTGKLFTDSAQRKSFLRTVANRGTVRDFHATMQARDGRIMNCLITSTIHRDNAGNHIGYQGIIRDITLQKQAEAERETLLATVERSKAELEQYAYTVSHDLKTPLITIQGFLGVLEEDIRTRNFKTIQHDFNHISKATSLMADQLNDLLNMTRIGRIAIPTEQVHLNDLVRETLRGLSDDLKKAKIKVKVTPKLPYAVCDRSRMLDVFLNLIGNAIKYTAGVKKPRISIGSRVDRERHVCYIEDNGIGVAAGYQDKIFEIFHKLDPDSPGTGIGLAIVRRILEAHDGRVWLESEGEGKGARFCFDFPGMTSESNS